MTDVINLDKADEKNATLNLHLKAKSGFNSKSSYSVSSNEWGAVIGLLEGTRKAVTIEHFNALAGIENPAAFVQAARGVFSSLAAAEATGLLEHGGIGEIIRADLEAFCAATGEA